MILPSRSDPIYGEIERFEDYEYTNCIAYEMAMRSLILRGAIDKIISYYEANENLIVSYFKEVQITEEDFNNGNYNAMMEKSQMIIDMIEDLDVINFEEYEFKEDLNYIKVLGNKFFNIFNLINDYYTPNESHLVEGEIELLHQGDLDELQIINRVYKKGFNVVTALTIPDDESYISMDENNEDSEFKQVKSIEDFRKLLNTENAEFIKSEIIIEKKFSRPELKTNLLRSRQIKIDIDLNLPLNELISYITHIKDNLILDNSIIRAPIELLGEKLEKANENPLVNKRTNKIDKEKTADMFFIYDANKAGMKKNKIQRSIVEYYTEKYPNDFTPNMDYKTIGRYLEIAQDYIDKLKYKELITGIQN